MRRERLLILAELERHRETTRVVALRSRREARRFLAAAERVRLRSDPDPRTS